MPHYRLHLVFERDHGAAQSALQARDLEQPPFHPLERGVVHGAV